MHGNPVNYVDPSGELIFGIIIIAGVTAAAYNVFVEQGYGKGGKCSNGETNFFRILDNARRNANRGEVFRRFVQGSFIGAGIAGILAGGASAMSAVGGIPGLYTSFVSLASLGSGAIQKATEALVKLGDSEIVQNIQSTVQQGAQWVGNGLDNLYQSYIQHFDPNAIGSGPFPVGHPPVTTNTYNFFKDTPISMSEAIEQMTNFVDPTNSIMEISDSGGYQFRDTFVIGGVKITNIARLDINMASRHVAQYGPHLNLQTIINYGSSRIYDYNTHIPIDPSTILPGDIP